MKRIICALMAAIIAASFAGCGKKMQQVQEPVNWVDVGDKYGYILTNSFWVDDTERVYRFEESGEYSAIYGELSYSGKWYLLESDGVLSLELQGGLQEQYYLTKLSNTLITMTDAEGTQYSLKVYEEGGEQIDIPADMVEWTSDFGYGMAYDKNSFTPVSNENGDVFRAVQGGSPLDEVYVAVLRYSDNSAASLAGGIEIQSKFETTTGEEKVGQHEYAAVTVAYHTDTAGMKFYLIEAGEDVLMIEVCLADDYASAYSGEVRDMLATLTVK